MDKCLDICYRRLEISGWHAGQCSSRALSMAVVSRDGWARVASDGAAETWESRVSGPFLPNSRTILVAITLILRPAAAIHRHDSIQIWPHVSLCSQPRPSSRFDQLPVFRSLPRQINRTLLFFYSMSFVHLSCIITTRFMQFPNSIHYR